MYPCFNNAHLCPRLAALIQNSASEEHAVLRLFFSELFKEQIFQMEKAWVITVAFLPLL